MYAWAPLQGAWSRGRVTGGVSVGLEEGSSGQRREHIYVAPMLCETEIRSTHDGPLLA